MGHVSRRVSQSTQRALGSMLRRDGINVHGAHRAPNGGNIADPLVRIVKVSRPSQAAPGNQGVQSLSKEFDRLRIRLEVVWLVLMEKKKITDSTLPLPELVIVVIVIVERPFPFRPDS